MILSVHTLFGVVALAAGAWNFLAEKGTRRHRYTGCTYTVSMAALIVTSFWILELTGGFGPFHAMSIMSGGTLLLALYFPLRRDHDEGWLEHHYF